MIFFHSPLVRHFVRYLIYQPATLQEIAGRVIKAHHLDYENRLPKNLNQYLNSAHQCVNSRCQGKAHHSETLVRLVR